MSRRRRVFVGARWRSTGLPMHATMRPRCTPTGPLGAHVGRLQSPQCASNTSTPLIYALKKKTQVAGVDMLFPENHNGHVQL